MSSSAAQLAANRANAQFSTGPRTEEGKQRSSSNALTHGLFSSAAMTCQNEREAFEAFRQEFINDLQPQGALEIELVDSIANLRWRARRCQTIEAGLLSKEYADPEDQLAALDRFSRYEARFIRAFHHDLKQLQTLQAARKKQQEQEFEEAVAIAIVCKQRNQPYDPTEDGFVFSAAELAPYISRRERSAAAFIVENRTRRAAA